MAYRILYPDFSWTACRNRNQWLSAPAMGVQVIEDVDAAIDWYAGGVVHLGDAVDGGNPPHVASGFDFYVWRDGSMDPEAVDLTGLATYLQANPITLSMDALQALGVKFGANVNREEWETVKSFVAGANVVTPNVPHQVSVLYYSDGSHHVVNNRADWATAPPTGVVFAAHSHPVLGHYVEGRPDMKASSRVENTPWALASGAVETWPLDQPRPWVTDIWGAWQDLIRDGTVPSSVPLSSVGRAALAAAGIKLWQDMSRDVWEPIARLRKAHDGNLLPKWGRRG